MKRLALGLCLLLAAAGCSNNESASGGDDSAAPEAKGGAALEIEQGSAGHAVGLLRGAGGQDDAGVRLSVQWWHVVSLRLRLQPVVDQIHGV